MNSRNYYRATPTTVYFSKEVLDTAYDIVTDAESTITKFKSHAVTLYNEINSY